MSLPRFAALAPLSRRAALGLCRAALSRLLLSAFLLAGLAPGAFAQSTDPVAAVQKLWASSLPDATGTSQALARYRGKPVVVNFWASWCAPCVQEMPALSAMSQQYAPKNIQFIGIGIDTAANIATFLNKVPVKYPVYVAGFGGADISRNLGDAAGGLPYTVVIDRTGVVRYSKLGKVDEAELKQVLARL
jgi:thiol-disulfide isomerase/thioredoxin